MSDTSDTSIRVRNVVIGLVVVAAVAISAVMWMRSKVDPDDVSSPLPASDPHAEAALTPADRDDAAPGERMDADEAARSWSEAMGRPPRWPENLSSPGNCDDVRQDLARICAAFDARAPALRQHGGACAMIEQLGQELVAAPPDLSSELRSYDTLLQNVFHLFRVAGRERMQAARRALAQEELAEPAALALYRWAISHERCSASRSLTVRGDALYAYAGFLFNTLGGQAYLRRRSPRIEALACFYGLQVLEHAIRSGHNPQGLDPRPEIPRCRALVASQDLVFSDRYVAELDAMARRWADGAPRSP
jgi:hypothetical protein